MAPAQEVALRLSAGAVIVLAAFAMRALAARLGGSRRPGAAGAAGAGPAGKAPRLRILRNPGREFSPSKPKWLADAVSWDPDDLPGPPAEPLPLRALQEAAGRGAMGAVELGGAACREQLFSLDPSFAYLNHGSYGAAFRLALEVQQWYRDRLEQQPVRFMETEAVTRLIRAVADVAGFVGAGWRDVVPVVNATTAVNTVARGLELRPGDLLLMANTTYPAVRHTLADVAAAAGAGLVDLTLDVEDLMDDERLVEAFRSAVAAGGRRLRLAVVDHVVSFPPVIMPVQRICAICRQAGVPVLVDGAHAVGALPGLDLPSLGCQYYTANLHKWMCSPKGAALLWVHPSRQATVRPLVVSHGYSLGFRAEFLWQGTSDPTAWLAAGASVAVMRALGPERVARHNQALAKAGAELLLRAWGTRLAVGLRPDGSNACMVAVQLPRLARSSGGAGDAAAAGAAAPEGAAAPPRVAVNGVTEPQQQQQQQQQRRHWQPTAADAAALNQLLRERHSIEVPVIAAAGELWVRISAQMYNSEADYQRLADAVQFGSRDDGAAAGLGTVTLPSLTGKGPAAAAGGAGAAGGSAGA